MDGKLGIMLMWLKLHRLAVSGKDKSSPLNTTCWEPNEMALNFGNDNGAKSVGDDEEELEGFEWFTGSDGDDGGDFMSGISSVTGG